MRSDWSTATTPAFNSRDMRSASSPRPQPTSSTLPGLAFGDGLEDDRVGIRSRRRLLDGHPGSQTRLVGVFRPHELGIVELRSDHLWATKIELSRVATSGSESSGTSSARCLCATDEPM